MATEKLQECFRMVLMVKTCGTLCKVSGLVHMRWSGVMKVAVGGAAVVGVILALCVLMFCKFQN